METPRFRIYNRTRERFLGKEVTLVDVSEEDLESRIESLAFQAQAGLWLNPYRELHPTRVLPLFDMVYLDEECRVIQGIELYPGLNVEPLTTQPASALVLPMGSILASRIQAGDCVAIRAPEQEEDPPPEFPAETTAEPLAPDTLFPWEGVPEAGGSFTALITAAVPEPVARDSAPPAEEIAKVEVAPAVPLLSQPRGWRRLLQTSRPKRRLPLRPLPSEHSGQAPGAIQPLNRNGDRRTQSRVPGPHEETWETRILRQVDETVLGLDPALQQLKARLLRWVGETARTLGPRTKQWKAGLQCWLQKNARDLGPRIEQGKAHVRRWIDETARTLGPRWERAKAQLQRWIDEERASKPVDRRRASRMPLPPLIAFYWTGGAPQPYLLGDISAAGTYLRTRDRSSPGTILLVTLQKTDGDGEHSGDAISVYAKVVRWGDDGVGLQFIPSQPGGHSARHTGVDHPADQEALIEFLHQLDRQPELVSQ